MNMPEIEIEIEIDIELAASGCCTIVHVPYTGSCKAVESAGKVMETVACLPWRCRGTEVTLSAYPVKAGYARRSSGLNLIISGEVILNAERALLVHLGARATRMAP